jgi:hypothetical protein
MHALSQLGDDDDIVPMLEPAILIWLGITKT